MRLLGTLYSLFQSGGGGSGGGGDGGGGGRGGGSGDGSSGGSRGDGGESNCSCELLNHASCSSCTHTFTLRPPRLPLHHPNLSVPLGSSEDPDIHREAFGACEET